MYFYNGAGVGAGDFDNDGLVDLFFSANQQACKLFLNRGQFRFEDVTALSGISSGGGWTTGASVVDINSDGLLDIYVSRVSGIDSLEGTNQLWVNKGLDNGVPYFKDEANEYGLDFSGNSTQAAFLDYDLDGDLDMFLLNHANNQNGTFAERDKFAGKYDYKSGDKLYRNDINRFVDVTQDSKINSTPISFGLGLVISDFNLDGWPDIYVGNDFHENDYMYINQKNGTFSDKLYDHIMHTSMYTMGVDAGDFNNDGLVDIISMDMLPSDPYMIKRSLGEDDYDIYNQKIRSGYNFQYTRNNLQLNRGNGMFSEIGALAGVHSTDWSWSTLFVDFNNDGWKDIFVSNGIPKRMNDIDYVNFISNSEIQEKLRLDKIQEKDLALVNKFPEIKLHNKFFLNTRDLKFSDVSESIQGAIPSFSNGAIYADFDNDGDLDIVTNDIDSPALVYENLSKKTDNHYLTIRLKGEVLNPFAIGSKIMAFTNGQIQFFENSPVHGFQSSTQIPVHIGLGKSKADSIYVVWPDNSFQRYIGSISDTTLNFSYIPNQQAFDYSMVSKIKYSSAKDFLDITKDLNINIKHEENTFPEFTRELLIPKMISTDGPALTVGDINNDGREDFFLGSSKTSLAHVLIQETNGKFRSISQPDLGIDAANEEVAACWSDVNGDGSLDLIVANGGNEYFGKDNHLSPCIYLNDGTGKLLKKHNAFDSLYVNASSVCASDFDHDGDFDLFIGGRSVPWQYGEDTRSYLLANDGLGRFVDVTSQVAKDLISAGMITDAVWYDYDFDGDDDLVTCEDWGTVNMYVNKSGTFTLKVLTKKKGWWNFILPVDIDADGDIDFIVGNQGMNSRLKPSDKEPIKLYYNDFDGNGRKEQLVTYYLGGKEIPFMGKGDIQKIVPSLKRKFLYAEKYAEASLEDLFSADLLNNSKVLSVNYFSNAVLVNDGKGNFSDQELPIENQFSPLKCGSILGKNRDESKILLFGNFYQNNIQLGRNDADFGSVLQYNRNGHYMTNNIMSVNIKSQVRRISHIKIIGKDCFILACNNDSLRVLTFKK
jgi:enediyne biosynthesis protein E4